ncbi:MAG: arginine--tRNA ligase [Acidobacteriaceae bacterium]
MYRDLQHQLSQHLRTFLKRHYGLEPEVIVLEQPPRVELGEFASPLAFELAKQLHKAPRQIAQQIAEQLPRLAGFGKPEIAGAGYLNFKLDRGAAACQIISPHLAEPGAERVKVLVEHTSINPNKAAHIGHLRNAILGDTFVRLLRAAGHPVDVQNYIDNTGVQVADVVVGFVKIEQKSLAEVEDIIARLSKNAPGSSGGQPFDYYCWDLYARVSQWYEQAPENKNVRLEALHRIEEGDDEFAQIGEAVSTAVLRRHLQTMQRLDIRYDFLPRESEILRLHFWDLAFEQLKSRGVLYFETGGKNKGCWVMKRAGTTATRVSGKPDEDAKVIVRSNGTVTYVGKDIAYHLWKFGLLGKDFGYLPFFQYPDEKEVWISAEVGVSEHPHFGDSHAIYNVIDTRQMDPQNNVIEALRSMGYTEQAARYTHFSYQMVALTPRCALELGYQVSDEDRGRAYIEVSGRKGFGVKADDLLDALIAAAQREVDGRNPELSEENRRNIANDIAIGALRYFMLKFTKNSVIAFDFKDALAFEGETGPYLQYTVTRLGKIFQKLGTTPDRALSAEADLSALSDDKLWELWLTVGKLSMTVEQCINTTEPAYLAKYAFQLSQQANTFYHDHHILSEEDGTRKQFLLTTAAAARRALVICMELMGIPQPSVM